MNREIKFRGNRVDGGGWVEGSYHTCCDEAELLSFDYHGKMKVKKVTIDKHFILVRVVPDSTGWTVVDTFVCYSVHPESVGQYTDLKDKNGKEIYEGDIVEYDGDKFVVVYGPGYIGMKRVVADERRPKYRLHQIQGIIIGNIYSPDTLTT